MKDPNELMLPAIRAHMGDWNYYMTFLRMEEIAAQVHTVQEIHSSAVLNEMIQQEISKRAAQISEYLLNQPERFFNSLVVGVHGGAPYWYELDIAPNGKFDDEAVLREMEDCLGFIHLDGTQTLFAIDGRHRVEAIKQALQKSAELNKEEVSVIFVEHRRDADGMERTRRLFTTLNRYAKPVSKSEIVALDEDDIIAIMTRELVEKHPLFQEKISLSKTKAIAVRDNSSFTTIITLYDVLETLFKEKGRGWKAFKTRRPDDETIAKFYANSADFWDTMIKHFPPLAEIMTNLPGANVAGRYRHRGGGHLLFRPVGLLIIADVVRQAKDSGLPEEDAIERLAEVSMELTDEPWVGLLWDKTNRRMISGATPQKVAKQLLFYRIGGDLAQMKTTVEKLQREYAGLLNREEYEVELPRLYASLP